MKIAIVTPVYKRPELTSIVLEHYSSLKPKLNIELIAVGSEGEQSKELCEGSGWNYIEYENHPLSFKINRLFLETKNYDIDGLIWIGSDDMMSENLLSYYFKNFSKDTPNVIGLDALYFYHIKKDEAIHFKYRLCKEVIGTGRFYSKSLLQKINYSPCGSAPYRKGVDSNSSRHLAKLGIKEEFFFLKDTGGVIVDMKSDVMMTPYEFLLDNIITRVDRKEIFKHFPSHIEQKILDLKEKLSPIVTYPWQEIKTGQ